MLYLKILKDKLEINAGMLMENIVAQMLTALGCKLFFFSNPSRTNKDDRMERDFLIAKSAISSRHNISRHVATSASAKAHSRRRSQAKTTKKPKC